MAGANYMGGRRSAAKRRTKDTVSRIHRMFFRKQQLDNLSRSFTTRLASPSARHWNDRQQRLSRETFSLAHAKNDLDLTPIGRERIQCYIPPPTQVLPGNDSSVAGNSPSAQLLLQTIDTTIPSSLHATLADILAIPNLAGIPSSSSSSTLSIQKGRSKPLVASAISTSRRKQSSPASDACFSQIQYSTPPCQNQRLPCRHSNITGTPQPSPHALSSSCPTPTATPRSLSPAPPGTPENRSQWTSAQPGSGKNRFLGNTTHFPDFDRSNSWSSFTLAANTGMSPKLLDRSHCPIDRLPVTEGNLSQCAWSPPQRAPFGMVGLCERWLASLDLVPSPIPSQETEVSLFECADPFAVACAILGLKHKGTSCPHLTDEPPIDCPGGYPQAGPENPSNENPIGTLVFANAHCLSSPVLTSPAGLPSVIYTKRKPDTPAASACSSPLSSYLDVKEEALLQDEDFSSEGNLPDKINNESWDMDATSPWVDDCTSPFLPVLHPTSVHEVASSANGQLFEVCFSHRPSRPSLAGLSCAIRPETGASSPKEGLSTPIHHLPSHSHSISSPRKPASSEQPEPIAPHTTVLPITSAVPCSDNHTESSTRPHLAFPSFSLFNDQDVEYESE